MSREKQLSKEKSKFLTVCTLLLATIFTPSAMAQSSPNSPTLSEAQAVAYALDRPALRDIIEGAGDLIRADAIGESLWPNPELSYVREQTFGVTGSGEDYISLSQRFDLSGRRGLRSDAADHRLLASKAQGLAKQANISAQVRLHFYETLHLQSQLAAVLVWINRLKPSLDAITRREAADDASAYDRLRLQREFSNAQAQRAALLASRKRAWASLVALIGNKPDWKAIPQLTGTLLPNLPQNTKVHAIEERPRFQALKEIKAAADLELNAAERGWIPEFDLGAGYQTIGLSDDRLHGFTLMATLVLPIFDRRQDESLKAKAKFRLTQGERTLALVSARAKAKAQQGEKKILHEAAQGFRAQYEKATPLLIRAAEAGYHGGELRVLELLDAYRGAKEDEERALDLEFQARRAHIDLEYTTGAYTP